MPRGVCPQRSGVKRTPGVAGGHVKPGGSCPPKQLPCWEGISGSEGQVTALLCPPGPPTLLGLPCSPACIPESRWLFWVCTHPSASCCRGWIPPEPPSPSSPLPISNWVLRGGWHACAILGLPHPPKPSSLGVPGGAAPSVAGCPLVPSEPPHPRPPPSLPLSQLLEAGAM